MSDDMERGEGKPERISPLFNDLFLKIFGSKGSEPVTMSLLNAIFRAAGIPEITHVEALVADSAGAGGVNLKTSRFDVVVEAEGRRTVDFEAQRRDVNTDNKSLFYAAKLYCERTPKGPNADYDEMPQVIVVTIHEGHVLYDDDCWLSAGRMTWDRKGQWVAGSDRMLFVSVEIEKLKGRYNGDDEEVRTDELAAWMYVLADGYRDEERLVAVMDSFPTIEQFAEMYGIAIDDPDIKRSYDKYYESVLEYNQMMSEARKKGEDAGREKLAARLRALGVDQSLLDKALAE